MQHQHHSPRLAPRFATPARVAGPLCVLDDLLVVALVHQARVSMVAAFGREHGEPRWSRSGLPPLAGTDGELIYCYGRTGVLAALHPNGELAWQIALPDDRPAPLFAANAAAPFRADVVPVAMGVVTAAGASVYLISRDGVVLHQSSASRAERAVVTRIAPIESGVAVTCGRRSPWDDGVASIPLRPWQPLPPPDALRVEPGELLCLDANLDRRWSRGPDPARVYGDLAPLWVDGMLYVVAALTEDTGAGPYKSLFAAELSAFDANTGSCAWSRPLDSGPGRRDPLVAGELLIVGAPPVALDRWSGTLRWRAVEPPMTTMEAILFLGEAGLLAISEGTVFLLAPTGQVGERLRLAVGEHGARLSAGPTVVANQLFCGISEPGRSSELRCYPLTPLGTPA